MPFVNYIVLGMPYPRNFETARTLESIVRENGAVPATIAILDGVPCIGDCTQLILVALFCIFLCLGVDLYHFFIPLLGVYCIVLSKFLPPNAAVEFKFGFSIGRELVAYNSYYAHHN